jgi:hypothetical protein
MAHPSVNWQAKGVGSNSIPEAAPGKVGPLLFPCTSSRAESLSYVPKQDQKVFTSFNL